MDETKLQALTVDIHRPLPGQEPDTTTGPWSDEAMAASFAAFAGQMGVDVATAQAGGDRP